MSFRMFNFSGGLDVPLSTVRCTRMVILDLFQFRREPIKAFSDLDRRRSKCETMAAMNQSGGQCRVAFVCRYGSTFILRARLFSYETWNEPSRAHHMSVRYNRVYYDLSRLLRSSKK